MQVSILSSTSVMSMTNNQVIISRILSTAVDEGGSVGCRQGDDDVTSRERLHRHRTNGVAAGFDDATEGVVLIHPEGSALGRGKRTLSEQPGEEGRDVRAAVGLSAQRKREAHGLSPGLCEVLRIIGRACPNE